MRRDPPRGPAGAIELSERMARAAAALLGGEVARMEPLGGGCLEEVTRVTLHASEGVRYGWATDYAYGPVALPNAATEEWPAFWAERRLLAHADALPADLARRVAALAAELPLRLPARPRPSLLHGDLWCGNVLVDGDRVSALIDPPCYHGHGEVDLAMLTLFDWPDARVFDAYPVATDWRERRPLYQLWPAIVHLLLFGVGYRGMVERLLREAGGLGPVRRALSQASTGRTLDAWCAVTR